MSELTATALAASSLLLLAACGPVSGGPACESETEEIAFDESVGPGNAAKDQLEEVATDGESSIRWHIDVASDDDADDDAECEDDEVLNPVTDECEDDETNDSESEPPLTWTLDVDEDSVSYTSYEISSGYQVDCPAHFNIDADLELATADGNLDERWPVTIRSHPDGPAGTAINTEVDPGDVDGALEFDDEPEKLHLAIALDSDGSDGELTMARRVETEDGHTDEAREPVATWPDDEEDTGS